MQIYNTLHHKVEEFVPYDGKNVKMYTCGPTVYNYAHIGNLRTYIFEDILEKSLRYLGYNVTRCMNITDVGHMTSDADSGEDKMIKATEREHKNVKEIATFYTEAFKEDTGKLNIKWPEIVSPATANIDMYIKIITKLLDNGCAYISGGNVYFDITKAHDYYELSGKNPEDLMVAVREDIDEDNLKRNPFDFGLWFTNSKFINPILQWDSPWGRGYPGWHIECSGISIKNLGEHLDIHCGGVDNIFPHHSNEIAQSEGYLGHKWCNYWVHGEHLNDASGKMSKSKGEFLTLSVLINKGYDPMAYRYFCLQSHYRNILVFTYDSLDTAVIAYNKLKNRVLALNKDGVVDKDKAKVYQDKFGSALADNLNTSNALTVLYDVLKDNDINDATKLFLVNDFDTVLSLDLTKETKKELDADTLKYANEMINKRNEAKKNKDYALADKIREELASKGIKIKDTREGTIIE